MSEQFGRVVELTVGKQKTMGRVITGLRMTFQIDRALEKSPNSMTLSIYNASSDTRRIIEQEGAVCQFRAGYGKLKDIPTLFVGDLTRVSTKRVGTDIVTEIEALDGGNAYETADVNVSFDKNAESGQVLNQILKDLGLPLGQAVDFKSTLKLLSGFVFSGNGKDAMDTILARQNLSWSVQDGQVQILPSGKATSDSAVVLTPSTGLVGFPFTTKVLNSDLLKKKNGKEAESGVELQCLLNGLIRPGRLLRVDSQFVKGVFRTEKLSHNGDTHGTNFYTRCEAKAVSS